MIRVILADDHEILRAGLKGLLERDEDFKVVAQARDGQELLEKLKELKADCIVMDLAMPHMDGLTALKEIHQKFPKIRVLVLTMQKDADHFKHAMALGASGYILKDSAFDQLALGLKIIMQGKDFISPDVSNLIAEQYVRSAEQEGEAASLEILTPREKEVLRRIAQGQANKNIATALKISVRTVEVHRSHLIQKLKLKTTASLVKYAIAKGLV
ncbi:MAG: response regulator transcription factor [Candidatus Omnitrophica bacterium]|nr:response regulator transcription factor [Candidatus Omnitrophota bacterium]